jgi:hypothetical protein
MMQKFGIALAVVLALAPFGAANAAEAQQQSQVSDASQIVDTLDVTTVGKLIAEIGGQKVETREEGDKKMIFFYDGDQPYVVMVTACEAKPGKCLGLAQMALVDTSPVTITLDQINTVNSDSIFLTGFKLEGNQVGFGRIIIVDGGVTRQNLAINIAAFVVTFPDMLAKLKGQLTSSLQQSQPAAAAAVANARFTPVMADPRRVSAVSDQMLAHYKTLLTQGIRR